MEHAEIRSQPEWVGGGSKDQPGQEVGMSGGRVMWKSEVVPNWRSENQETEDQKTEDQETEDQETEDQQTEDQQTEDQQID